MFFANYKINIHYSYILFIFNKNKLKSINDIRINTYLNFKYV